MKKIVPIINDIIFKEIMTDETLKDYVSYLISDILKLDYNYVYKNMEVINTNLKINNIKDKRSVADIIIKIENNIINLEANREYYEGLLMRNYYYLSKIISNYYRIKDKYKKIGLIAQINFNEFKINDSSKINKEYMLIDKEEYDIELKNVKQCHINLDKLKEKCYINNELTTGITKSDKARLILVERDPSKLKELAKGDEMLERVVKRVKELNEYEELMEGLWDYEEDQRKILNTKIDNALEEGMEKGLKKGIKQGVKQGVKQGMKQAALNLLDSKIDINIISKCTGLSINDIKNLN